MLPAGKGQSWGWGRLAAVHTPGGPTGLTSSVGHVCSPRPWPAREELGREGEWTGGRADCGRREPREIVPARRSEGAVATARTEESWPTPTSARGPRVAAPRPGPRALRARALTVRVFPLGALPVVHPAEPLEVVVVAAPRPVHRHHSEVRHRALPASRAAPAAPAACPPARLCPRRPRPARPARSHSSPLRSLPPPVPRAAPRGREAGGAQAGSSPTGVPPTEE